MLVLEIVMVIFICMAFFTLGVIVGWYGHKERKPIITKTEEIVEDATTALEKRIAQLNEASSVKFNPYYKGIYLKETL